MRKTIIFLLAFLCPAAFIQAAETTINNLEWGLQLRERGEVWEDRYDASAENSGSFVLQRLRLHFRYRHEQKLEIFAQIQDSRAWGEEASTASNEGNLDLHQGYLKVDEIFGRPLSLTAGRQEIHYGEARVVGAGDWTNIGRSFDAMRGRWTWGEKNALEFFAAKLREETPGSHSNPSAPPTGSGDGDDQGFHGVYAMFREWRPMDLDAYVLHLRDGRDIARETGAPRSTHIFTLGLRAASHYADSRFQWSGEAAWQTGRNQSDTHRAYAAYLRGIWTFDEDTATKIILEGNLASGESSPTDGDSDEFNNLFPTNHQHYGYADLMGWRNQQSLRLGVQSTPREKWGAFSADIWHFRLAEAAGRWSSAGGATLGYDPTGASGRNVGSELDLTWRKSFRDGKLGVLGGYSLFQPGSFAKKTRGSDSEVHFAYLQFTVTLP